MSGIFSEFSDHFKYAFLTVFSKIFSPISGIFILAVSVSVVPNSFDVWYFFVVPNSSRDLYYFVVFFVATI